MLAILLCFWLDPDQIDVSTCLLNLILNPPKASPRLLLKAVLLNDNRTLSAT